MRQVIQAYKNFRPFTPAEAWELFKLAAFGEAIGWTLLIVGIACKQLPVSWSGVPVSIFGQIHGMLFLFYIVIVLVVSPSLNWSLPRTILAGLFSIPPYGSLFCEQISAHYRKRAEIKQLHTIITYRQLVVT